MKFLFWWVNAAKVAGLLFSVPFFWNGQLYAQAPGASVQGLRDIKPPLDVSLNLLPYIVVGSVVVACIAASGWLYLRTRRQTVVSPPPQTEELVPRPPHEIAIEQLEALEAADCNMAVYHTQIAHVIREYISARYRIPALELTTTGLLEQMAREQIGGLYIEHLRHFLANCDKVKFATYRPEVSEAATRMADALWFVDVTKTPLS